MPSWSAVRRQTCINWLAPVWALALIFTMLVPSSTYAAAGKFDVSTGAFQISSKTPKTTTKLSNFGVYKISYFYPLLSHLELGLGYTVVMSSGIGGDLGYGLDVAANWYPITTNRSQQAGTPDNNFVMNELWRPFLGISFNQRQFQSIQAGYAGFGIDFGIERVLTSSISLKVEGRYLSLTGPSQGAITEMDGYAGISVAF